MNKEISQLSDFLQSVLNEFWHQHPSIYGDYCHFLGRRVSQIQEGLFDEEDYIESWKNIPPPKLKSFQETYYDD